VGFSSQTNWNDFAHFFFDEIWEGLGNPPRVFKYSLTLFIGFFCKNWIELRKFSEFFLVIKSRANTWKIIFLPLRSKGLNKELNDFKMKIFYQTVSCPFVWNLWKSKNVFDRGSFYLFLFLLRSSFLILFHVNK